MKISKKRILEIIKEEIDHSRVDDEGGMAKSQLYHIARNAMMLHDSLKDEDQLEGWVQSKITKAADYMKSVADYLEYEMGVEMMDPEKINDLVDRACVLHAQKAEARDKPCAAGASLEVANRDRPWVEHRV